ncbi:23S rRNA (adenine(2030)-N(6))-methyltransferase RlmJ [Lampropedia puyangensis]|uniref:Ribosomal RNA large subunit methyltransferase J n=1 Tax=Lampropedia puyangensis TaxID=1330072 RepID=A0A4S8EWI9_9BURK|nr:23S rRNA (adenine(2030)-N(6))-methyltransferase RlmJ [Lampropedia puyangensis]THT97953.1 23S rRNA (adenine(2030)-N(6))-methyltransferase RlmJ [Lampropedia puyangensis]
MFSYRHAFHAGNHADVLKHTVLLATLDYLKQKDVALTLIDTHAGNGIYRLDGDFAQTSNESASGIQQLIATATNAQEALDPTVARYLDMVRQFNDELSSRTKRLVYPGSPALLQHSMRSQDQLHLFELQPADMRALQGNMEQGPYANHTHVWHEESFKGSLRFLPPPSRRGLVLCDPSYELKTDYQQVSQWLSEALRKFATGTYLIWYPVIPRPEAHELPRKLKAIARQAGRGWLHTTLAIKSGGKPGVQLPGEKVERTGMVASGMVVINPPYILREQLQKALPELVRALGQDHLAAHTLESAEAP